MIIGKPSHIFISRSFSSVIFICFEAKAVAKREPNNAGATDNEEDEEESVKNCGHTQALLLTLVGK